VEIDADPWFPPWVQRHGAWAAEETQALSAAVTRLTRAALASIGLLHKADAVFDLSRRAAAPHLETITAGVTAVTSRVAGGRDAAAAIYTKAVENLATLFREFQLAGAARREHEARFPAAGLNPDREARQERAATYPKAYWSRQGARAEHLGADALGLLKAVKRRIVAFFGGVREASADRAEAVKMSFDQRAGPSLTKVRLALARLSAPVATRLLAHYPAAPRWVIGVLGPLSSDHQAELAVIVGDTLGWTLLAMGAVFVLYLAVFRERATDRLPDDATVEVEQVPADDGTFLGKVMGGGVDLRVTLPGVIASRDCNIMVALDEVKVRGAGYRVQGSNFWVLSQEFWVSSSRL
jgi:HAMP domain-containing protein